LSTIPYGSYTGNEFDAIWVDDGFRYPADVTVRNLGVPHYFSSSLQIDGDGERTGPFTFTIEAGAVLSFAANTAIDLGTSSAVDDPAFFYPVTVVADGTPEAPITFTSAQTDPAWFKGRPVPNRLRLLREWVAGGGALLMIGGYYSFQGINGGARYHKTPVEEVLPVECLPYDDRVEVPEGFAAELVEPEHPILTGLGGAWPLLLGCNEVRLKQRADVRLLARLPADQGGHPLLVAGSYGKGRTLAWTSDIGPHWLPQAFADWPGYAQLWRQALSWLTSAG
jgi:hypothetical protein